MGSKIIELEEGWSYMLAGVTKLKKILEGEPEPEFDSGYYMSLYTTIFTMCRQDPPHNYSQQLYDRYGEIYEDYYMQTVLPSLRIKHGEYMLKELAHRWSNHKIMVRWLTRFFYYLDRYFIKKRSLPTLNEVGLRCFRDLVDHEMRSKAKDVVLALIYREREGEQIDRELLKNVLDVYVENGMGKYEEDFEIFMLQDTASYYSSKASSWIQDDSCPEYMLKSEECLKKERDRVIHYLHSTTEPKLVKKVQNELLVVFAKQLLENEHSGFLALIRDDKMDDLSRMYKLYHSIPKGLELVADLFNKHVTAEGNILIKQTEDAATNQAAIVTELGDKYMVYVTECFQNHIIFHKALQAAFEFLGNKKVAASSSREELLATFCDNDNLLKKGGETKHGDGEEFGDEGYI